MFNPLHVQELLECCLQFLRDSQSDLKSCALVCRAWVYAAQTQLFSHLDIFNSMVDQHLRILQLSEISQSPHILALVIRLDINLHYLKSESFLASIAQFTRLRRVRISGHSVESTSGTRMLAIRALLGLSTVQHAEVCCTFPSPAAFLRIWDGCSENITHLELGGVRVNDFEYDWASAPASSRSPKIQLACLRVWHGDFILPWLSSDACPFAFSQVTDLTLTMLKLNLINWRAFQPHIIKRLEFGFVASTQKPIDLAPFTRLHHLAFQAHGLPSLEILSATLASIPPANPISRIFIDCRALADYNRRDVLRQIDDLIASMLRMLSELVQVELLTTSGNLEVSKEAMPKLDGLSLLTVKS
ncbi:hypothetical protein MSAN_01059700 [Mycena sanguinolenta]|uniref:F-box domain-containing protein n=1 Tax=Mycena sanguinolenta TaxID=230812 RepID=A0A8H6YUA9_9AGAR|nr:hypothetical protein MSAN_01059700 [Mycena sanguinolenta]